MPNDPQTTLDAEQIRLELAARRIRGGIGTKEDERLIEKKFDEVKWKNIRALKRDMRHDN
jgi:hypothetical protein